MCICAHVSVPWVCCVGLHVHMGMYVLACICECAVCSCVYAICGTHLDAHTRVCLCVQDAEGGGKTGCGGFV